MILRVDIQYVSMASGEYLTLEALGQGRLYCTDGCLWVTDRGCLEDVIVGRGESVTFEHPRWVLVVAFRSSTFLLEKQEPPRSFLSRIARWRSVAARTGESKDSRLPGVCAACRGRPRGCRLRRL
jgi:hypothetical protein